jgi:hypothetical protein
VRWPDGRAETLPGTDANQVLTIEEGKGVVAKAALPLSRGGAR